MAIPYVPECASGEFFPALGVGAPTTTGARTFSLSDGYSYGSSGRAITVLFKAPETANLTEIGVVPSSFTGTWASTDGVINFEIREGLNGNRIPGTTLTGSGTIALATGDAGRWTVQTGLSVPLVAGRNYCIVLYDADGGGTNFVTMLAARDANSNSTYFAGEWGSTTNGFSTAYTQGGQLVVMYMKIGTRRIVGEAMQDLNTFSGGTNRRGSRFRLPFDAWLIGSTSRTDGVAAGTFYELYADAESPGGTVLTSFEVPGTAGSGTVPGLGLTYLFPQSAFYRVLKDTWYRFVMNPPSSTTTPRRALWTPGATADIIAARSPWEQYWTLESAGTWSDDPEYVTNLRPLFVPDEPASGSSNPQRVITF